MQTGPSINNNAKSDTFDIYHYDLELDFTDLPARYLRGRAVLHCRPLQAHPGHINLDLLLLQVDSVRQDGLPVSFSHNDTILQVQLAGNPGPGDSLSLEVFYQGSPPGDGSGWGGWHQSGGYFFNLGVGFAANPHTYGRAWHPCYDNFVERATYRFLVKTRSPRRPYCNGLRMSETALAGDTLLTEWRMEDPIPTYLASVAISNYTEVNDTLAAQWGPLPVQLMAQSKDSAYLAQTSAQLAGIMQSFENSYGPYRWQKVGYAVTAVGAMEHATSIHLPRLGSASAEEVFAHELAHHWWGNLVTCETDQDMWINEGMSEYSSFLYQEEVYGRERYLDKIRENAYLVLENAHNRDGAYRAIQGLDHEHVYGYHVYQKGAWVAHNLRGYLGDSLFFAGLTSLLVQNQFSTLSSTGFRDQLSQITGYDLTDFFDDWVFAPGYTSVWIDSLHTPGSGQPTMLRLRQAPHQAPRSYRQMPVEISFFAANGQRESRQLVLDGDTGWYYLHNLPFVPQFALAAYDGSLVTADIMDHYPFDGQSPPVRAEVDFTFRQMHTDAELMAVHHYAGPGLTTKPAADFRLSRERFWTLQGYSLSASDFSARISFDGTNRGKDQDLAGQTGDSLIVMHRAAPGGSWKVWPHQQRQVFNTAGGALGYFELDSLLPGDYALANATAAFQLPENRDLSHSFEVYPNPAQKVLRVKHTGNHAVTSSLKVVNMEGKLLYEQKHHWGQDEEVSISLENAGPGAVLVILGNEMKKVILEP